MNKALKKYVGWLMPLLIVSVLIACPTGDTVVPDAPTNVETAPGNTKVTVSWTAPSGTGGADITDYTVYWGTEAAVTTDTTTKKSTGNGSVTSLTITGLTNGTMYYFIVTATNSAGESIGSIEEATVVGYALAEGGTFKMGSPDGEGDADETQHDVTVSTFYISKYETTHAEYIEFLNSAEVEADGSKDGIELIGMGNNPIAVENNGGEFRFKEDVTIFPTSDTPVANVTWYGAVEYANWLSNQAGLTPVYTITGTSVTPSWDANGYRLPTEAEWEYAARGGDQSMGYKYAGSDNVDQVGWYSSNSGFNTHPVGQKKDNELKLYDMSGNVWEWCWDWYGVYSSVNQPDPAGPSTGLDRVLRGGSWNNDASSQRSANRSKNSPGGSYSSAGFRLARPAVL